MATFEVTVTSIDWVRHPGRTPLLTETIEIDDDFSDLGDGGTALEVLKLVPGAECPYDCDTCRED